MKCDTVSLCLNRFKFEKIEENKFHPDDHHIGQTQRLKIRNLTLIAFACKGEPKLLDTFS
jgi:hypothetical protein